MCLPTARAYIRRGLVALGKGNYFVKLAEGAKFRLFFFDQNICVRPPDNRRRHASKFSHSLRGRQWYKKMVQGPEYSVTRFGEFWNILVTKFLTKKPNILQLFGLYWNSNITFWIKNVLATFRAFLEQKLVHFLFKHLVTLDPTLKNRGTIFHS